MIYTSWYSLLNLMLYILLSHEDEAMSPDECDAVDAAFLLTCSPNQNIIAHIIHIHRHIMTLDNRCIDDLMTSRISHEAFSFNALRDQCVKPSSRQYIYCLGHDMSQNPSYNLLFRP